MGMLYGTQIDKVAFNSWISFCRYHCTGTVICLRVCAGNL